MKYPSLQCAIVAAVVALAACDRSHNAPARELPSAENTSEVERSPEHEPSPAQNAAPNFGPLRDGVVRTTRPVTLHEAQDLVLEAQRWEHDGQQGIAWRVRVPLTGQARVVSARVVQPLEGLTPADPGPWAAINGGFYEAVPDAKADDPQYRPMGLVVSDGTVTSKKTRRGGSGIFVFDSEGPAVVHRTKYGETPRQALQSIDRIVENGQALARKKDDAKRAARSAVVVGEQHLWLVALAGDDAIRTGPDGARLTWTRDVGLPLWAFADYLIETTKAVDALNLDGGISTQLVVRDADFQFRIQGARGTINALVVRPR